MLIIFATFPFFIFVVIFAFIVIVVFFIISVAVYLGGSLRGAAHTL